MNKWSSLLSLLIFNNCRELRSDHGMLTCGLVGYFAELKYFDWAEMWLTTHYFWLASRMNKSTGRMKENWVLRLLFYKERNVWVVCVCVCVCVCSAIFSHCWRKLWKQLVFSIDADFLIPSGWLSVLSPCNSCLIYIRQFKNGGRKRKKIINTQNSESSVSQMCMVVRPIDQQGRLDFLLRLQRSITHNRQKFHDSFSMAMHVRLKML